MSRRLPTSPRVTRRDALRQGGAEAACAFVPSIHVRRRPRLRILGTPVTLQEPLRRRAEADLGIDVFFEAGGSAAVLQKASTHPASFDVYEQWSGSIELLWPSRAVQPIDRGRIEHWDEVDDLCKTGLIAPGADVAAGDAPLRLLNVQSDGALGGEPTTKLAFLPYVHNVDGYGYDVRACGPARRAAAAATSTASRTSPAGTRSWAPTSTVPAVGTRS